ncbi:MAG: FAD-dependent oxidoreductase, partial [Armatimonadetes bacterium]|nr:FAD-dependent oxidoreductase [Armatimonadota bacterium]
QIPFDEKGSMFDRGLSRPIDFGIFPNQGSAQFYDKKLISIPGMFRMSGWDWARWSWLMLKTWSSNLRTEKVYSRRNAAEAWASILSDRAARTWRSCFGPWIGSDWTRCSLHTAGQFFRKQLITRPSHRHAADRDGPGWVHRAGDGWLLLRGPSSEVWFDRWLSDLRHRGMELTFNDPLVQLDFDGRGITAAHMRSGTAVKADQYILATTPFAAAEILSRTPSLEREEELRLFRPLIQDGPHVQVSFRIAFAEPIAFPRDRPAAVVTDSEFNLTLFAQEQAWEPGVDLGRKVRSLWTGTSCAGNVPGRLFGVPVVGCTKEQFIQEVKSQILSCQSLDALIREANHGRGLEEFPILRIEVWHEWLFHPGGIQGPQPKWVTTTNTQAYLPNQKTSVANLFLAGAHTRTAVDVWSIEGAVESGRRAARAIDPRVRVLGQYKSPWLRALSFVDDLCFRVGAPHVLDVLLYGTPVMAILLGIWSSRAGRPPAPGSRPVEEPGTVVEALATISGPTASSTRMSSRVF